MKSLLCKGLLASTFIFAPAAFGEADPVGSTITLSRIGTAPGHGIRWNYDFTRQAFDTPTGASLYGIAGVNKFNILGSGGTDTGRNLRAFCVEMNEGFVDDPIVYTYTEVTGVPEDAEPGPMSITKSRLMQDFYKRNYRDVTTMDAGESQATTADEAAAFQLIVWEISHENLDSDIDVAKSQLDLQLGAMAFTDTYSMTVLDIANQMIDGLGMGGWKSFSSLYGLTNENNQDLLVVVPSPAIAGLAGLGLAGMRRRRR